jgi:predicted molibdopterin-dependent oxidoreductase YjgC
VDFSEAAPNRAAAKAIESAFGTEALPADMINLGRSDIAIVIADDLESSHNVAALRVKDSVVGNPASPRHGILILVSHLWGEMADFAEPYDGVWLQPRPGAEPAVVDALAKHASGAEATLPATGDGSVARVLEILAEAKDEKKIVSIVYVPSVTDAAAAANGARAAANLTIALRGERAAESLFVLPTEANVYGARDMGMDPERGPGRVALEKPGMDFQAMIDAANAGTLKAMIVVGDNPLMFAPDKTRVRRALESLDLLVVVDSLMTDTAAIANAVFADVPTYAKTGSFSNGERRVDRLHAALDALGDARPALLALTDLAGAVGGDGWQYDHPDDVTDEIAEKVPGYERFRSSFGMWSKQRVFELPSRFDYQPVEGTAVRAKDGQFVLTTARTLFTSLEGAEIHSPEADKLHREEYIEISGADAGILNLRDGDAVTLVSDRGEINVRVRPSGRVQDGVLFLPYYYDGGAICTLLDASGVPPLVTLKVAVPA